MSLDQYNYLIDSSTQLFGYVFVLLFIVFFFGSIILFIVDAIKAKKENRKIKIWIKVIFIISMIHIAISVLMLIFFFVMLFLGFIAIAFGPVFASLF